MDCWCKAGGGCDAGGRGGGNSTLATKEGLIGLGNGVLIAGAGDRAGWSAKELKGFTENGVLPKSEFVMGNGEAGAAPKPESFSWRVAIDEEIEAGSDAQP